MPTVAASPIPILQFLNNAGQPNVGGSVLTQVGGINAPTYQDNGGTIALPNPIPLNSRGEISDASGHTQQLFLPVNTVYTFTIFDANGNQIDQANYVNSTQLTGEQIAVLLSVITDNPVLYTQVKTQPEIDESIAIANYSYFPGNILRYGADRTNTTDSTVAVQAAVNQQRSGGPAVYAPNGAYLLSTTITCYAGTKITGDGRAFNSGSPSPTAGTGFNWQGGSAPAFSIQGVSTGNYATTLTMRDFSVYNRGGANNAIGVQMLFAPFSILENIYIAGFIGSTGYGIEQGDSSFQCAFIQVDVVSCDTCVYSHDAGEDTTWTSCLFRSFNYVSGIGFLAKDQCQTTKFLGCDLSDNNIGAFLQQGDSGGMTPLPLPFQISFDTCQFENVATAAIVVTTSSQNQQTIYYPSLDVNNCRFFNAVGGPVTANNGQAVVYAQCLSQATFSKINESGYSFGGIFGVSRYGQTFTGTALSGPIIWGPDSGMSYGTSRFLAGSTLGSLVLAAGDHSIARFTATAITPTSATALPFSVIVSDVWGWYFLNGGTPTVKPTKAQTIRFCVQFATASAPTGAYKLQLFKNGSAFLTMAAITVSTAGNALVMTGEAFDVPAPNSDLYNIVFTPPGSVVMDIGNSFLTAEVAGE